VKLTDTGFYLFSFL